MHDGPLLRWDAATLPVKVEEPCTRQSCTLLPSPKPNQTGYFANCGRACTVTHMRTGVTGMSVVPRNNDIMACVALCTTGQDGL